MSTVDFYYDFSSPYSYLGSTQIERVVAEAGGGAAGAPAAHRVAWKPILLGGLFKALGTVNVPLFEVSAAQRTYQGRDLLHWADHWGVELRWPSRFPMNTVSALRLVLAADEADRPRLSHALYRAYWVEDRDLADKAVLVAVARAAGLDGEALALRLGEPGVKAALIASGEEAMRRGVFGVPTFFVGDQLVFGQDRLEFLVDALGATGTGR